MSRATQESATLRAASCKGCHPLWRGFPVASTHGLSCDGAVLQPRRCRDNVGLGSSPVARHYWGIILYFLFLRVLRCFSSPRFASRTGGIISLQDIDCPIQRSAVSGHLRLTAAFSQLITSFIACKSLGIHRTRFISSPVLYSSTIRPPLAGLRKRT